jgi:hypothetical protein
MCPALVAFFPNAGRVMGDDDVSNLRLWVCSWACDWLSVGKVYVEGENDCNGDVECIFCNECRLFHLAIGAFQFRSRSCLVSWFDSASKPLLDMVPAGEDILEEFEDKELNRERRPSGTPPLWECRRVGDEEGPWSEPTEWVGDCTGRVPLECGEFQVCSFRRSKSFCPSLSKSKLLAAELAGESGLVEFRDSDRLWSSSLSKVNAWDECGLGGLLIVRVRLWEAWRLAFEEERANEGLGRFQSRSRSLSFSRSMSWLRSLSAGLDQSEKQA